MISDPDARLLLVFDRTKKFSMYPCMQKFRYWLAVNFSNVVYAEPLNHCWFSVGFCIWLDYWSEHWLEHLFEPAGLE